MACTKTSEIYDHEQYVVARRHRRIARLVSRRSLAHPTFRSAPHFEPKALDADASMGGGVHARV